MESSHQTRRVVTFSGKYHHASSVEHIEAMADAFPDWELTVLQEDPPQRWGSRARGILRRWTREPVSYPLRVLDGLINRISHQGHRPDGPVHLAGSLAEIDRPNVRYVRVPGLHRKATLELVRSLAPWLGVSIGAPILKRSLFGIPARGTINIHKSLLPDYRGMPPGFWELHDGTATSGVSIHWIDDGLDTGQFLLRRPLSIPPYSTPAGLAARLDVLATDALLETLRQLDAGTERSEAQAAPTTPTRGRPPWFLARRVRSRAWQRRAPAATTLGSRTVEAAKLVVLASFVLVYCRLRNALRGRAGTCHAAVLLYHRVSDEFLDTVTVGIEQFERHLSCLKRNYDVVDIPAFLASRGAPRRRPCVVLTFDDGYEDNVLAATLLRRAGLPCTFFISTRIVGTDRAFPHDQQRLGRRVPALAWDQVRQMAAWGFRIANHTAHHANLGALATEPALAEVASAREDLQRELGDRAALDWLAYPYGQPGDITTEVRSQLPALGIPYCFSAYGGTNPPCFDPLNILRQGIDYKFTELRLRAAIEGWRWRS